MKCVDWFEGLFGTTRVLILTLCCAGAGASPTWAQTHTPDSSTRGFSLGGHVAVIGSNPDSFDENGHRTAPPCVTAVGGGLTVAYGVNEWLTVVLNGDGRESEDDRHLSFADIGAQLFLPGGNRLRPHFDVALTGRRVEFEADSGAIDTRGAGLTIGGGVLYFVSRAFPLDATLLWTAGDLDQHADGERVQGGAAIGVSGMRFLIGIRWFIRR